MKFDDDIDVLFKVTRENSYCQGFIIDLLLWDNSYYQVSGQILLGTNSL